MPVAKEKEGISVLTNEWAPIIEPSPIVEPLTIVALAPIQTSSPISIGAILKPASFIGREELL